jgi:N-acetylmuramic acid 6-phosphate etherase
MNQLSSLLTETRNRATENIDQLSTLEMMRRIHEADREMLAAVERELPNIARALDAIVERMRAGGRLFYIGAGTSGRLGVLDASECPPTFGVSEELVQGVIAGGDHALRHAVEGAEDNPELAEKDLASRNFGAGDVLVGIAASGRTPYVLGGMSYAEQLGAVTVGVSCVPDSLLARSAQFAITPATGAEVITGSTRMKAGTATKLVLNMLSTGAMIRLGCVYGNLMVNVRTSNVKLRLRARHIVAEATGLAEPDAVELFEKAGSVKTAIIMHKLHLSRDAAEERLEKVQGELRRALEEKLG